MNKKWGLYSAFFIGIITALSFIPSLVSAQFPYDLRIRTQEAIQLITDFLSPFLEFTLGVSAFDQYFWVRVLLLVLIFIIVFNVLDNIEIFKKNTATRVIVSLIISIFSAKYIGELDIINGILLPYGVMGIALTFLLPFIVFFYFVHKSINAPVGRRAAWIFFAIVFFGLWLDRADQIGPISWIYFVGVVGVVLSIIFDPKIHEYFGVHEMNVARRSYYATRWGALKTEYENNDKTINAAGTPDKVKDHLKKRNEIIDKEMKRIVNYL